jgi:hypothetical protein
MINRLNNNMATVGDLSAAAVLCEAQRYNKKTTLSGCSRPGNKYS